MYKLSHVVIVALHKRQRQAHAPMCIGISQASPVAPFDQCKKAPTQQGAPGLLCQYQFTKELTQTFDQFHQIIRQIDAPTQ